MASGKQKIYDNVKYSVLEERGYDTDDEGEKLEFTQPRTKDIVTDISSELEANGVHLEKAKILSDSATVRVVKRGVWARSRNLFLIGTLLVCVAGGGFFFIYARIKQKTVTVTHYKQSPDWSKQLKGYGTESSVCLVDVDGDRRDDIILSVANNTRINDVMDMDRDQLKAYCMKTVGDIHCVGALIALRGYDGKVLWQIATWGHVFELNCANIDIDLDGKMDCTGTGRFSQLVAFDPRKGQVLWEGDTTILSDTWNIYNPLIVPDLTGDGVKDVVIAHGGDPKFPPEVHVRFPGKLLLIDGASGRGLGKHGFEMRDKQGDKETYMSPILHTTNDGSMYVLYGMGGETVRGSFHAISLPDLYRAIVGKKLTGLPGNYSDWPGEQRSKEGIVTIYRSPTQGVMVPPVLVDMDHDGVKDILMLAFDSTVTLYNGQTLKVVWTQDQMKGYETYTSPAPGYFTDDSQLDFMIHLNKGAWADYNYSLTVIIDGASGEVVWTVNTTKWQMSSDLVVRTTDPYRDAFLFRIQGRELQGSGKMKRHTRQFRRHEETSGDRNHNEPGPRNRGGPPTKGGGPQGGGLRGPEKHQRPAGREGGSRPAGYRTNDKGSYNDYDGNYMPYYQQYNSPGYDYMDGSNQEDQGSNHEDVNQEIVYGDPNDESDDDNVEVLPPVCRVYYHPEYLDPNYDCSDPAFSQQKTEVFLVDRSTWSQPIRLYTQPVQKLYYNLTAADHKLMEIMESKQKEVEEQQTAPPKQTEGYTHQRVRRHRDMMTEGMEGRTNQRVRRHGDMMTEHTQGSHAVLVKPFTGDLCSVWNINEKSTGAIGDLDGDGSLDLVYIFDLHTSKHDNLGSYVTSLHSVKVAKFNLKDAVSSGISFDLHPKVTQVVKDSKPTKSLKDVTFRPKSEQPWGGYLGSFTDSVYRET